MKPVRRIAFRADASTEIGTGHLMRCLALAEAFPKDFEITFHCFSLLPHLETAIREKGFRLVPLKELSAPINDSCDLLIVDHYRLNADWEKKARNFCRKLLAIDDVANREHDADFLLDQNFSKKENRYKNFIPKNCKTLLGPEYALLRPEIKKEREGFKRTFGEMKMLFVSMGGVDAQGATLKVLEALPTPSMFQTIHVTTTPSNPHLNKLKNFVSKNSNVQLHINSSRYFSLMKESDVAIAAGGSSTWERLYLGLPTIQVIVVDNQLELTQELNAQHYVHAVDLRHGALAQELKRHLEVLRPPEIRKSLAEKGMKLVDGLGSERIASALQ